MKVEGNMISIIIPVFNIEKYIEKCILSVTNQTYKNLQIVLVDDGSTDQSGKICDIYAEKDCRIQVIHQNNSGLVCARKIGLKVAKGQYIGFVDGDDYIEPNMYEEMINTLLNSKADFIHTGYLKEENGKQEINVVYESGDYNIAERKAQFLQDFILEASLNKNISYSIWSKLFKRELIQKCYQNVPNSQSYGEDMLALCACVMESNSIYMKKSVYYHYVYRNNSMTNSNWSSIMINIVNLYKCLQELLEQYCCYDKLEKSLEKWFQTSIVRNVFYKRDFPFCIQQYFFPDVVSLRGKKVALYGAGVVGKDYYAQICKYQYCSVEVWADQFASRNDYAEVVEKEQLNNYNFDLCIIAVNNFNMAEQIRKELIEIGIKENKIVWKKPQYLL